MPREITKKQEFSALLASATAIRVVKKGEEAKVKLRTKKSLYTFKTTSAEAGALTRGAKVPIEEFSSSEAEK